MISVSKMLIPDNDFLLFFFMIQFFHRYTSLLALHETSITPFLIDMFLALRRCESITAVLTILEFITTGPSILDSGPYVSALVDTTIYLINKFSGSNQFLIKLLGNRLLNGIFKLVGITPHWMLLGRVFELI